MNTSAPDFISFSQTLKSANFVAQCSGVSLRDVK